VRRKFSAQYALAVLLFFIFSGTTLFWISLDQVPPNWDDAWYLTKSLTAYDALTAGVFVWDGSDIVGVTGTGAVGGLIAAGVIAVLAMAGGAIAGLVAWIGALINTAALDDKMWFVLLLVLGLLSFGLIAMIVYVIAGPDSTTVQPQRETRQVNLAAGA